MANEGAAFKAAAAGRSRIPNKPRCSHCLEIRHEKDQYFEIIGYPPNWQARHTNQAYMGQRRANQGGGYLPGARAVAQNSTAPGHRAVDHNFIRLASFAGQ